MVPWLLASVIASVAYLPALVALISLLRTASPAFDQATLGLGIIGPAFGVSMVLFFALPGLAAAFAKEKKIATFVLSAVLIMAQIILAGLFPASL